MALSDVLGLLAGSFGAGLSEYGAEQQRQQELARKRAEEERIRQATQALFRGGDVTPELAGAAITAGVSPTVVGSAQMFGRRQEEPVYTERKEDGGTAIYKDGVFERWKTQPPRPRPRSSQMPDEAEQGAGLAYLDQWLRSGTPADKVRKGDMFRRLRAQYPNATPGAIGFMIMGSERGVSSLQRRETPEDTIEW